MSKRITETVWQVGGSGFSDSSDAAIYLIISAGNAALVDAGTGQGHVALVHNIRECLPENSHLEYILLTHCHFDHAGGADALRNEFGCRIVAHELDSIYLETGDQEVTAASWYGSHLDAFPVDVKLKGEESIVQLGANNLTAIHCPGHSPGSVIYTMVSEEQLLVFAQDVHGPIHPSLLSDEGLYQDSLRKLAALNADILLEGHYGVFRPKGKVRRYVERFFV